jgi:hypothetical protein
MSVATDMKMRELRIVWVSRVDGALRMTWVDETLVTGRTRVEAGRYGR